MISRNEGAHLRRTVENLQDTLPGNGEILVIDDGSTDGSAARLARRQNLVRVIRAGGLGVARARNRGARETSGRILVFADAHLELQTGWWQPMLELLERPNVGAVAPVITDTGASSLRGYGLTFRGPAMEVRWLKRRHKQPVSAPILPGCCLAMRREVFLATGGWDEGMLHRGNVDNEFSIRHWLLGYELLVTPDAEVGHLFRPISPYPVGVPEYLHNRLRLAFIHLHPARVAKAVAALRRKRRFGEALLLAASGDAMERRRDLLARRVRDDDWFFSKFNLRW